MSAIVLVAGVLVAGVLVTYQFLVLALMVVAWRNSHVPHDRDPSEVGIGFETVTFPTRGCRILHGWWIPSGRANAPVVVLVHG